MEAKKSFKEIYGIICRDKTKNNRNKLKNNEKKVIKKLYKYLLNCSQEEFLIYNYKHGALLYNTYSYFIIIFIIVISGIIANHFEYINNYTYLLTLFLTLILLSIPEIFVLIRTKKENTMRYNSIMLISKFKIVYTVYFILMGTLIGFIICYILYNKITIQQNQEIITMFESMKQWIATYLTISFDSFDSFDSYGKKYSNQISFSSILFTYAIGGTVIFSFADHYCKQFRILESKMHKTKEFYNEWYLKNKILNLDLKQSDNFYRALNELRYHIKPFDYINIRENFVLYRTLSYFIAAFYIGGIIFLIGNDYLVSILFQLFIPTSALYFLTLYSIFTTTVIQKTKKINLEINSKRSPKYNNKFEENDNKYYINEKNN